MYILRSTTSDGLPLWFTEGGPTIERDKAFQYSAADVERARAHFAFVFDMEVWTVEVGSARDPVPSG